jgi:hypothetical protein
MRKVRKYALTLLATTSLVTVVLLVTGWDSAVASQISNVFVTNTAANPVPVSGSVTVSNLPATQPVSGTVNVGNLPGSQTVDGTVDVGNFPSSQTVDGSVSPAAPAAPVLLRGGLPANPGSSETFTLFNDRSGVTTQPHRIAVGSITVSTEGGTATSGIYVSLRGTDCHGNGLAGIANLTVQGDSTEHLDFPVPEIIPVAGSAPFCVVADVLNGNELGGGQLVIRVVGYEVS